jgi:alpha-1,3-glucosyltransferase
LVGGVLFAVLLNLKHIFLYFAPVYFVYLLRTYCSETATIARKTTTPTKEGKEEVKETEETEGGTETEDRTKGRSRRTVTHEGVLFVWERFLVLGAGVGTVFLVSFGPFWYFGQLSLVLGRLFPFGRGLCHAYWAPNFWALYNLSDKLLTKGKKGKKEEAHPHSLTLSLSLALSLSLSHNINSLLATHLHFTIPS